MPLDKARTCAVGDASPGRTLGHVVAFSAGSK
nr:MAG TPA: hypothetical protein [Caudoviricetes sp.]